MSRGLRPGPYPSYKDSGVEWIGEIPIEWDTAKLKNVFKIVYRYPNYYGISYVSEGVMEIRGEMLKGKGIIDIDNITPRYISEETSNRFPLTKLEVGDIVMSVRGTMGKIGLIDKFSENSNITANLLRLSPKKEIVRSRYLSYLMESNLFLEELQNYSNKTTIMTITVPQLLSILIPLPDINLQKEISEYLEREIPEIDSLIADKEKLISLLEEKRQAVITETVTKGLDPNVKMKDSGIEWIGEMPEHWEVSKLKFHSKIKGRIGYRGYTTEDFVDENKGALTLGATNISKINILDLTEKHFISWDKFYESPEIMIEVGDLIVAQRGSIGKLCIIETDIGNATINPSLILIKDYNENKQFLYWYLNSNIIRNHITSLTSETAVPMISQEQLGNFYILIPPIEDQFSIAKKVQKDIKEIDIIIGTIKAQISKLNEYRESLIYEAVTGKIDLRDYGEQTESLVAERSEAYGN